MIVDRHDLHRRAAYHAALGDPIRLAIVDELRTSDRSPTQLAALLGLAAPLLSFHLDVLEAAGVLIRSRSSGDRRRKYVHLTRSSIDPPEPTEVTRPVVFVCTHNAARSQLAAALWQQETGRPATSGGTQPAPTVHPGAIRAARRVGLDISNARPVRYVARPDQQVITVCDRAHEELATTGWHWSVADPATAGTDDAFDEAVSELSTRIRAIRPLTTSEAP